MDLRRRRADLGSSDGDQRSRLLLDLRILLELRVEPQGTADFCRRCRHWPAGLALPGRRVQPGDRRPRAAVPHRLHVALRARSYGLGRLGKIPDLVERSEEETHQLEPVALEQLRPLGRDYAAPEAEEGDLHHRGACIPARVEKEARYPEAAWRGVRAV